MQREKVTAVPQNSAKPTSSVIAEKSSSNKYHSRGTDFSILNLSKSQTGELEAESSIGH